MRTFGRRWLKAAYHNRHRKATYRRHFSGEAATGSFNPQIRESCNFLSDKFAAPHVMLILGSGLGFLADQMADAVAIPYADIPHFAQSTAPGHRGRLVAGRLGGVQVLAMQGRFHLYEGYTPAQIAYPVRVAHALGVRRLIITCACGSINPILHPGDLTVITDYINFTHTSALVGQRFDDGASIFVDVTDAFCPDMRLAAHKSAANQGITLKEGVYFYTTGPQFETPAEIRAIRTLGADLVGMSLVHETVMARRLSVSTLAIGLVTNIAAGLGDDPPKEEDIFNQSTRSADAFSALITGVLQDIGG